LRIIQHKEAMFTVFAGVNNDAATVRNGRDPVDGHI
jgi:hypothetical protein